MTLSTVNRRTAAAAVLASAMGPVRAQTRRLKVVAVFAYPFEQAWVSCVHSALKSAHAQGQIEYKALEDIRSSVYASVMRQQLEAGPDILFGESTGMEGGMRQFARDFPRVAIAMGSTGSPQQPNFSVFAHHIHEPTYLTGMLAGGLTQSGHIGLVGSKSTPETHRLMNAFMDGAREVNPDAKFSTGVIDSWLNTPRSRRMSNRMMDQGADVLFAGTTGVIGTVAERKRFAFGSIAHLQSTYPDTVVASAVWHAEPTVQAIIERVTAGLFTGHDFGPLSAMRAGGASLSPLGTFQNKLPAELIARVRHKESEILAGRFVVPIQKEITFTHQLAV